MLIGDYREFYYLGFCRWLQPIVGTSMNQLVKLDGIGICLMARMIQKNTNTHKIYCTDRQQERFLGKRSGHRLATSWNWPSLATKWCPWNWTWNWTQENEALEIVVELCYCFCCALTFSRVPSAKKGPIWKQKDQHHPWTWIPEGEFHQENRGITRYIITGWWFGTWIWWLSIYWE